ncbi:MAG: FAD-dependent oxidoreductase [Rubrivivax sp.]
MPTPSNGKSTNGATDATGANNGSGMNAGSGQLLPWPYAIAYGQERRIDCDVLVLGGGIAGVWAAIAAARCGARVVILEKAATERSGAGGAGVDHWQWAADNPASAVPPEEFAQALIDNQGGWRSGISTYIQCASAYETLLEMERYGGKVRDDEGEFAGADFRDPASKLLFAYDYANRTVLRVWGHDYKPLLREACRRLGVRVFDRVAVTSLLTEGGVSGTRVVGATGVHGRSGAFVVARAKSVVLAANRPQRIWTFFRAARLVDLPPAFVLGPGLRHRVARRRRVHDDGEVDALAVRQRLLVPALRQRQRDQHLVSLHHRRRQGQGSALVDAWGRPLATIAERCRPVAGQKFFIMGGGSSSHPHPGLREYAGPRPIPDLEARMRAGEFTPPFYADLAGMPEMERRAIWGVMVGNEGKTRIPVKHTYEAAGFDPERDMLQSYDFLRGHGMREPVLPQERTFGDQGVCGGLLVDWDLQSNLPGLFGAGDGLFGGQDHSHAACSGRYAGARAALAARALANAGTPDAAQVEREKARVYAPLAQPATGPDWKELNAATARVMQNYCSEPKHAELLALGRTWLADLEANEAPRVAAGDPHELMRVLEVQDILTCSQMIVSACEARRASSAYLHFERLDFPAMDPPEWHKWLVIARGGSRGSSSDGEVAVSERPIAFGATSNRTTARATPRTWQRWVRRARWRSAAQRQASPRRSATPPAPARRPGKHANDGALAVDILRPRPRRGVAPLPRCPAAPLPRCPVRTGDAR